MQQLIIGATSALKYIRISRLGEIPAGGYCKTYGSRRLEMPELVERGRVLCKEDGPLHTYAQSADERVRGGNVIAHVWSGPMPESQLRPVDNDLVVCNAPLAYVQAAKHLDEVNLALIAYELTGTYAIRFWDEGGSVSLRAPEITIDELRSFCQACVEQRVHGSKRALKALDMVAPNSNSAAESALALQFTARGGVGGLSLKGLELNRAIRLPEEAAKLQGRSELRPDGHFANTKTGYEYESDERHLTPRAKARDSRRSTSFSLAGYKIYQLSKEQVQDPGYLWDFGEQLRREIGGRKRVLHWDRYLELHCRLQITRDDPLCS